tara:strand:+ start:1438 stop:2196 length:759 start_codon:yes stop_codon:yes gene_type:complete
MGKLSQKEILSEGFASGLRGGIARAARGAAAVGGALKQASAAGNRATVGDFVAGGKAGYEAEKIRQKTPETELDKAIEEFGYIKINPPRGNISDVAVIEVADLDYDSHGARKQGQVYNKPLILKWDKQNKTFGMVKGPKGETSNTKSKPGSGPGQVTRSNFKFHLKDFVKNNLKGADFMSKLSVTEFVRSLAKTAGNANWYKNLPQYITRVKKDNKIFSNIELEQLINLMIQDKLMTESQKTTLRQLTLISG